MKVFVWHSISYASNNYHSGGGVVVFAETEERAREIANAADGCKIGEEEKPDEARECAGEEKLYIMPDSGCC